MVDYNLVYEAAKRAGIKMREPIMCRTLPFRALFADFEGCPPTVQNKESEMVDYNLVYEAAKRAGIKMREPATDPLEKVLEKETEKQRLTREASTQYFAKLRKPKCTPIGEAAMLKIAGEAIREMETRHKKNMKPIVCLPDNGR